MRKLVTVRRIIDISPIPGADNIEKATIDGWHVVVKKDEFRVGDYALYFEIDSWIPTAVAPFLTKPGRKPSVYQGVEGERLKTVKLRGQISQGLLLPFSALLNFDLSQLFGVLKWERSESPGETGSGSNFPTSIPKTEQERVQNVRNHVLLANTWHVTEKLEGSSMTCYLIDGVFGVCSRNLDLIEDEANVFWKTAKRYQIEDTLRRIAFELNIKHLAIQGELIGPGIQGNIYKLTNHEFRMFDILVNGRKQEMFDTVWNVFSRYNIPSVPLVKINFSFCSPVNPKEEALALADGLSELGGLREGLVFRSTSDPEISFKAVSNQYLIKEN